MSTRFEMMSATTQAIYMYYITIPMPHYHVLNVRVKQISCLVRKQHFQLLTLAYSVMDL